MVELASYKILPPLKVRVTMTTMAMLASIAAFIVFSVFMLPLL